MRESKRNYLVEYNKYKDVVLSLEETYIHDSEKYKIVEIDDHASVAKVRNLTTGVSRTKSLHWCRKNLLKE